MPTVLRVDGLRVSIFLNDHPPPHTHVFGSGHEVIFNLNCPSGPPTVRNKFGFNERQLKRIRALLQQHVPELCAIWERMHVKRQ